MALAIPLDERAAFVRMGRDVLPGGREPIPTPTPAPAPEEIGQEDLSGRAIRGYALGERIGAGGFGAVYRAVQPLVEREVAIKIILPQYANHPDFIRRFEAEAQLVARLEHPHIVPLYDYWREPGVAYLVMRLLRGGSVNAMLEGGSPPPIDTVLRLVEQIGAALHAAHRIGVVHRDLKPGNVLLDEDSNAYLADFGIAKNLGNPNLEDQTQAGALVGSPVYMSPEQIRAEFVRPQADIYCLGVMLYELLTGHVPFSGPTPIEILHQHLTAPLPPLAAHRAGLPVTLDAVIARATAKDPHARYDDALQLVADFHQAVSGEWRVTSGAPVTRHPSPVTFNPYKGLRAFGEADAADFFGRDTLTHQLLARLGEGGDLSRFLAVVGPSGSGKSSVVKAGLIPALRRGGLPGSENWFIVDLLPGAHPLEEIETALLRVAVNPPESLLAQLREDKRGLLRAVHRTLPADEATELMLVIDQFEEVFTLLENEAERAHLLDSLVAAVLDDRSRVRVVITLRADSTDRPLRYVDFGELLRQRSEFVLPLTPEELERAIAGPAERVGLRMEAGLVPAILRDVSDQPGALPLLQYALTELFEQREDHSLTKAAYQSIGGVLGALGRRAEEVYAGLDEAEQAAARQMFLRLVTLGEGVEDTRRRVLRTELEQLQSFDFAQDKPSNSKLQISNPTGALRSLQSPITRAIENFGKARLLSFDRDPLTRGPTVEVAHEALLREWPRLRTWLDESRADVRMRRLLAGETAEWLHANRDASFLLTGSRLEQFEGWALGTDVALTQDERAYLDASMAEGERKQAEELERQRHELELTRKSEAAQRTAANRLRTLAGALTIFLLVAIGLTAFAFNQQDRAKKEARLAASRELAAAAVSNIGVDPELSILLALQAVTTTYSVDKIWTTEAEDALHRAIPALQTHISLSGHSSGVSDVAFSPDGLRLATASRDGTVKVWEAATGKELFTLGKAQTGDAGPVDTAGDADHGDHGDEAEVAGQAGDLYSVSFSPDGAHLATGGRDGTVKVWDMATGQVLLTLGEAGHTPAISAVAFSPVDGGRRLAVADSEGTVQMWDVSTPLNADVVTGHALLTLSNQLGELSDYTIIPNDVVFSPDGTCLATVGEGNTAKIWDAATGQELLTLSGHTDPILDLAFSPDGLRLVTASDDRTANMWDWAGSVVATTNQARFTLVGHGAPLSSVTFNPDGRRLATASLDGTVKVWDAASGQELFTLTGHRGTVEGVAFSPDGTRLATASSDTTARLWDASPSGELFTLAGHTDKVFGIAFSPDGTRLATSSADQSAKVWDTASGQELFTLAAHTAAVEGIAFSPDGTRVATGRWDGTAKIWDAATGQEMFTLTGHSADVGQVAFSPDGTRLATASVDKTAKMWDAATGQELFTLAGHTGGLHCLAFSPDGTRLITGGDDSVAIVWDLITKQEVFRLPIQTNFLTLVAYSPDGTRIATASTGEAAEVWDARTGQLLMTLSGHAGGVWGVAFSPNGKYIATTSADKTSKIWDAATGEALFTLYGHAGTTYAPSFSPDGTRLATASSDGTVRVYLLRIEDLVELARSRVTRPLTEAECQKYLHVEACP